MTAKGNWDRQYACRLPTVMPSDLPSWSLYLVSVRSATVATQIFGSAPCTIAQLAEPRASRGFTGGVHLFAHFISHCNTASRFVSSLALMP